MTLKTLSTAALLATTLATTACTDREVAFGAGVVVGAIISDDGHHHHHRPHPPRYRRGRRYYSVQQNQLTQMTATERVSAKYGLSLEQAELLTSHLVRTQQGDLSAMAELGFDKSDLIAIYEGRNPSASTLETLGSVMGLDVLQAHQLIQDIKADAMKARETMM